MLDRSKFLVAHGADPKAWAERYGIEPIEAPCSRCGKMLATTLPFAFEVFRGLLAPPCECGFTNTPYCLVSDLKHGDLLEALAARAPREGKGDDHS